MKLTDEQIKVAVEWWKNVLRKPKFDTLGATRSDPREQAAATAEIWAAAVHQSPQEQVLERFAEELAAALHEWRGYRCWLNVDYGPCKLLYDAAEKAGLDTGILSWPWKTSMNFGNDGNVTVAYGYGAPLETLLEASVTA